MSYSMIINNIEDIFLKSYSLNYKIKSMEAGTKLKKIEKFKYFI